jgi:hypothetical protein
VFTWSRDGNLYYRAINGMLMAVAVNEAAGEFPATRHGPSRDATRFENSFNVAPDGKRFPMLPNRRGAIADGLLVQNFVAEVRQG